MAQLETRKVTIQIKGVIDQNKKKEEIASILRMLQFSCEELQAYGFDDSASQICNIIENLQHQLNSN